MKIVVSLMILFSQFLNVLVGGGEDEMLCSQAWRKRRQPFWRELCWLIDNFSPLMYWKGSYATHCEACYWEEKLRLQRRLGDYD